MTVIYTSTVYSKYRQDHSTSGDKVKYNYYLTVDAGTPDLVNNRTPVTLSLYMYRVNSGTQMWNASEANAPTSSITVDGDTRLSTVSTGSSTSTTYIVSGKFRTYYSTATPLLISQWSDNIDHNADGTKNITIKFNWIAGSGGARYYYPVSFESNTVTIALPSIARSSTISSVNSITIGADLTATLGFTITRYANSFYHKLSYTLDGATYQIWSTPVQTTSGSIAYSTLINQVKTGASKALVFTLTTYSSSAGTTQIGTAQTKTVTVNINTSVYKPSVSLTGITIDTSPINTKLIGGYSIASIAYSGTNPTGSTKTTVYFTASNASLATTSVEKTTSTFSGNVLTTTLPVSKGNYTFTVYAYAKDSRGVSSATVQLSSATVYKYTPPVITASAFRVEDDVSTTQDDAGTYVYLTYSAVVGTSIDGTNSIQTVTCTYTGGTAQSGDHIPLSEDSSLVLTFTATDLVGSNTVEITINPATYPLDLYDDGTAQHQGVGLCAIAEPDKIKCGKDVYATNFVGNLIGDLTGDIIGNLTGDVTGNVLGDVTGDLTGNVDNDGTLSLGATADVVNMLGTAFKWFANGTMVNYINGNATDADNLMPHNGDEYQLGGITVALATSNANRVHWPTTTQRGVIVTIALSGGTGAYAVQFCYMNASNVLYMRYKSTTWQAAWKSITFS